MSHKLLQFINSSTDLTTAVSGTYDPWLVILSVLVASVAAFAALQISERLSESEKVTKYVWLVSGAMAMGCGIWTMHFVGMVAFTLPVAVTYDLTITLVSMIPAIIASAIALHFMSKPDLGLWRLNLGGVLMGVGIGVMHYTGMAAMIMDAKMSYDPLLFALSIVVAHVLATFSLYVKFVLAQKFDSKKTWPQIVSAAIMGCAVAGMHYTGMAAAYYFPGDGVNVSYQGLPPLVLGFSVAGASIIILAIAVISTFSTRADKIRRLTIGYLTALSLIALLSLSSYALIKVTLYKQASDAPVINLAGRQRMLSQKLANEAVMLVQSHSVEMRESHRRELAATVATWSRVHSGLLHGDEELELPGGNSKEEQRLFAEIESYYRKIKTSAEEILALESKDLARLALQTPLVQNIVEASPLYLEWMDRAVFQYEKEAQERIDFLERFETYILISLLLLLCFVALFIFRPMVNKVRKSYSDLQEAHGELELRVEKRTAELAKSNALLKQEVVEHKQAEKELRESEIKFRSVAESANEAVISADSNGNTIFWNRGSQTIFGYPEEEVLGKPLSLLIPERYRADHQKGLERMSSTGESHVIGKTVELHGLRKDGSEFPLELSLAAWMAGGETFYTGIIRDITTRKHAEEELRRAHNETEQLLASISSILIGISPDDRVTRWNAAAEQIFGIEGARVLGKSFLNCAIKWNWQEVYVRIAECREKDKLTYLPDIQFTRIDGSEGFLNLTVNPIANDSAGTSGYLLLATEITERKLLESQLSQAQKLESIGQLAAGIAHEINTPIQYVGDNTRFLDTAFGTLKSVLDKNQQLLEAAKEGSLTEQLIAEAESAIKENKVEYMIEEIPMAIEETLGGVERVATIVRAMKEFSHPGAEEKTLTDINKALENTITVAHSEWKYVAEMEKDFENSLPLVPCLPGEMNQVFLNIIVNAAHAIAEVTQGGSEGKGVIKVSTASAGDWVEIRISDSGTGIPEEVCPKIFDPFFTTKEVGKGTGQGLAIAHNVVVEKHGGSMNFETEIGKGTIFIIRLPVNSSNLKRKGNWVKVGN